MLWLDDCKFHVCGSIYQEWVVVCLERSSLTCFPVGGQDILAVVHALQVSMSVLTQLFQQILIVVIFVFAGSELPR